jgi:hypothetical protein
VMQQRSSMSSGHLDRQTRVDALERWDALKQRCAYSASRTRGAFPAVMFGA